MGRRGAGFGLATDATPFLTATPAAAHADADG